REAGRRGNSPSGFFVIITLISSRRNWMARPDLNSLLNIVLPFARQMLAHHGEFYPFGAQMSAEGETKHVGGYTGDEHPPSQELIDLLKGAFQARAKKCELRATALCIDIRTIPPGQTEKVDAIYVELDHADGESVKVFLPYAKDSSGAVSYGELF